MQFIKHVDPKFNRPRKPIVVNELMYLRRGYCSNASMLLLVVVQGLHEILLFKLLLNDRKNKIGFEHSSRVKIKKHFIFIGFTWLLFVNVSQPLHNIQDRKQSHGTHDNISYQSLIQVQYYVVLFPNVPSCVDLCIQSIYNVGRNIVEVQNCRMHNINMIMPEMKSNLFFLHWHKTTWIVEKKQRYTINVEIIPIWDKSWEIWPRIVTFHISHTLLLPSKKISTYSEINDQERTFCRRASCDTHVLNIPWMTLKAFGPNSLKYSLKCSHEAFIILCIWFASLFFSSSLVSISFSQFLVLGTIVLYWLQRLAVHSIHLVIRKIKIHQQCVVLFWLPRISYVQSIEFSSGGVFFFLLSSRSSSSCVGAKKKKILLIRPFW